MSDLPWEDALLERKSQSDLKDLLKTLVAFANSVKPGHIAEILIGELNDGTVQGVTNADNILKKVRKECDEIYPPIVWQGRAYEKDGKTCVRVEIEYDGETPHFGGPAWVRRGSVTEKATDDVFQRLIDFRGSKVRELAKWQDKAVTVVGDTGRLREIGKLDESYHPRWLDYPGQEQVLRFVNSFWVTVEVPGGKASEPLEKVTLSWDDQNNRLKVLIKV